MLWGKTAGNWAKKNIPWDYRGMSNFTGGWGGIRTPGRVAPSAVFKTVAFDRSATHPKLFLFAAQPINRSSVRVYSIFIFYVLQL